MMKKFVLVLQLAMLSFFVNAQVYNNEWVDFTKTYYKFKVGTTDLYHITQPSLAAIGLGSANAQNFQLWRNGKEIPLYTSVAAGPLTAADYIEFYGVKNDGVPDAPLYRYDSMQMNKNVSLLTDTAAYFLTINVGVNKRLVNTLNDLSGVLTPQPYFMYTLQRDYTAKLNKGYGLDVGSIIYSSSYESGEGFTTADIATSTTVAESNLFVYTAGPNSSFRAVVAGDFDDYRTISATINGTGIASTFVESYNSGILVNNSFSTGILNNTTNNILYNHDNFSSDQFVISNSSLTYPRQFNFGGQTKFEFTLPASATGNYFEIANFNYGSTAPVLFDLTNNLRIVTTLAGGLVKVKLPPSVTARKLVLLNTEAANTKLVNSFTQRNFVNYASAANQGNYVIISHPLLFDDGAGNNNVDKYRIYRNSAAGGGYNAIIADEEQLTDQFAFGIKHHPLSVRNFSAYALANFTAAPQYFFLVGKGLNYVEFRNYENAANVNKLALVPTFGEPASDNLLTATRTGGSPKIPIGRLSAITGAEVGIYLAKIKQYEAAQQSTVHTVAAQAWKKNVAHITGAVTDPSLYSVISGFMQNYEISITDSLFGGKVFNFSKNSGLATSLSGNKTIDTLFSDGLSLLTYFGHSSPNALEFNLDNPESYNNTGKYPVMLVNGCTSGNLFTYDTLRAISKGTLSEKYVFADQKGGIAFIADTHFGIPYPLNLFTQIFYDNVSHLKYGETLGRIMQNTADSVYNYNLGDFTDKIHSEEITLHGDPAIKLNAEPLPDYVIEDSLVTTTPAIKSAADDKFIVNVDLLNIGKSVTDSFTVRVTHQHPNGTLTIVNRLIKATDYEDTLQFPFKINPIKDTGVNQITVSVDATNKIAELSETNNTVIKTFTILEDEIRPVYPYPFSIVNDPNVILSASTADPLRSKKTYLMEMDTTELFNSPSKITRSVFDSGGVIKFVPGITLIDSTVYYWRVALSPANASTRWLSSSFVYINGTTQGYNQSHFYQFKKDDFTDVQLDSASRNFYYPVVNRKLTVRTGLYPYYGYDQINVNVDNNSIERYGCRYNSLQIIVMDSLTMAPWENYNVGATGRYGSGTICGGVAFRNFFEFPFTNATSRAACMSFLDLIPNGNYITITNLGTIYNTSFIDQWKADTATLGSGNSLYHKLKSLGFTAIDSFYTNKPFSFVYKKGDAVRFPPQQAVGNNANEQVVRTYNCAGKTEEGKVITPWIGPAKTWKRFKWNEKIIDANAAIDERSFNIYGQDPSGDILLATITNSTDTTIGFINAAQYPYLKVEFNAKDTAFITPSQLKRVMLTADLLPEGGVSPNLLFSYKDTLTISDTLHFKVAFKNVSNLPFDSLKVYLSVTDKNGSVQTYSPANAPSQKVRPLPAGDTVRLIYNIPCATKQGLNFLSLDVNPNSDQLEEYHFNNVLYRNFLVLNPLPVDLLSFYGQPVSTKVQLNWKVAAEHNINKYEVLRSADGRNFVQIGEVASTNSVTEKIYGFTDNTPLKGINYYKLRIVDLNSSNTKFSNIVPIRFDDKKLLQFTVLPNPATDNFVVNFKTGLKGKLKTELFNATGQMIYSESFIVNNETSRIIQRPLGLPSGNYLLKITEVDSQKSQTLKIIFE